MAIEFRTVDSGIGILTFANAANGNSVEEADLIALRDQLELLSKASLRALIVTGAGENFCHGRIGKKGLTSGAELADDLNHILAVNERLSRFPVPVIAAVEGEALGFGCGFATQCDITFAGEGAVFGLPELSHGLPPLIVLSYLIKYVPLKRAFELALTSRHISAQEAAEIGIVTKAVAKGAALDTAIEMARFIVTLNPRAVQQLRMYTRRVAGLHDDSFAQYGLYDIAAILSERTTKS